MNMLNIGYIIFSVLVIIVMTVVFLRNRKYMGVLLTTMYVLGIVTILTTITINILLT